jgi:hypothetical protein
LVLAEISRRQKSLYLVLLVMPHQRQQMQHLVNPVTLPLLSLRWPLLLLAGNGGPKAGSVQFVGNVCSFRFLPMFPMINLVPVTAYTSLLRITTTPPPAPSVPATEDDHKEESIEGPVVVEIEDAEPRNSTLGNLTPAFLRNLNINGRAPVPDVENQVGVTRAGT